MLEVCRHAHYGIAVRHAHQILIRGMLTTLWLKWTDPWMALCTCCPGGGGGDGGDGDGLEGWSAGLKCVFNSLENLPPDDPTALYYTVQWCVIWDLICMEI
jgi:hypothetical protein